MSNNGTDPIYPDGTFGPNGEVIKSPYYGYLPSEAVGYTFVILFGLTTFTHLVLAIRFRLWWLLYTVVLAGVGECLGWSGRLWSVFAELNQTPYLLQIVATILAPTPFVAALFITFSRVIQLLGVQYSRLSPRWYSRIFLTADIIALVVQGAGGGLAASANTESGSNLGANIMLGGIIFQLISLVCFITVAGEWYFRYILDRPVRQEQRGLIRREWDGRMKIFLCGFCGILLVIFIRSIYRTAELADGWNGTIINTEWYFVVFDGAMIVTAMIIFNVVHPGFMLFHTHTEQDVLLEKLNTFKPSSSSLEYA